VPVRAGRPTTPLYVCAPGPNDTRGLYVRWRIASAPSASYHGPEISEKLLSPLVAALFQFSMPGGGGGSGVAPPGGVVALIPPVPRQKARNPRKNFDKPQQLSPSPVPKRLRARLGVAQTRGSRGLRASVRLRLIMS
jgi:hypothetical protein